jgi:hypothetical protein
MIFYFSGQQKDVIFLKDDIPCQPLFRKRRLKTEFYLYKTPSVVQ